MKKIVAFTAFKRCGKDTAAAYLEEYLNQKNIKYIKKAFAEPLKKYVCKILDISLEELEENKEKTDIKYKINNQYLNIREILVLFADTLRDVADDGIWSKLLFEKIKNDNKVIIITDLRFLREYKEILNFSNSTDYEINIIRIKSDLSGCQMNENELDIPKIPVKYTVNNIDGVLEKFYLDLHEVFDEIFEKEK